MGRVNSEAAALLVAGICRGKFWASPEETERWLKTETGQRIAALGVEAKAEWCPAESQT